MDKKKQMKQKKQYKKTKVELKEDRQFENELMEAMMTPIDPSTDYGNYGCVFLIRTSK